MIKTYCLPNLSPLTAFAYYSILKSMKLRHHTPANLVLTYPNCCVQGTTRALAAGWSCVKHGTLWWFNLLYLHIVCDLMNSRTSEKPGWFAQISCLAKKISDPSPFFSFYRSSGSAKLSQLNFFWVSLIARKMFFLKFLLVWHWQSGTN